MQKNSKTILYVLGSICLLLLYVNRPQTENPSATLKGKPLFEVAESLEMPNKVERSPMEDAGTVAALDQKPAPLAAAENTEADKRERVKETEPEKPGTAKKSLWDAAEKEPASSEQKTADTRATQAINAGDILKIQAREKEAQRRPREKSSPAEDIRLVSTAAPKAGVLSEPSPSRSKAITSSMSDLISMSASSTTKVSGRDTMAMGNLLQEGSSYLGILEDPIRVIEGEPQTCTIVMVGKLSQNTVNGPFKMTGVASLNKDKTKVCIEVKRCVDSRSSSRAVDCFGTVGDTEGWNCISGVINSPGIWGTIVRTAGIVGSQMSLSSMTSSITQAGVLMDQTQSNALLESLSAAYKALGNDLAEKIESKGTSISISGQSIVRVRITKDAPLW